VLVIAAPAGAQASAAQAGPVHPPFPSSTPLFLHFVAFRSRRGLRLPKVHPSTTHHPSGASKMITAFFMFVTVGLFAAIVIQVAESVSTARAFA
jgi:hypothetical protein